MTIDRHSGTIVADNIQLEAGLKLANFKSMAGVSAASLAENQIWHTFSLKIQEKEKIIGLLVFFKNEILSKVGFTIVSKGSSWSAEFENSMETEKKDIQDFLRQSLGNPPYDFAWGNVSVESDIKSASSRAIVAYR